MSAPAGASLAPARVVLPNGVVLVTAINRLREGGMELREAVLTGAATRLRPVLMTALVASLGFVLAAGAIGFMMVRSVTRPLGEVQAAMR